MGGPLPSPIRLAGAGIFAAAWLAAFGLFAAVLVWADPDETPVLLGTLMLAVFAGTAVAFARLGRGAPEEPAAEAPSPGKEPAADPGRDRPNRLRMEQALRESEQRFQRLVDNAADAIFVIGEDFRVLQVNEQACRNLGYMREELLTLRVPDFTLNFHTPETRATWERLSEGPITIDGTHRCKDGSEFPVEVRASRYDAGGEKRILAVVRDVTDRKRAEERSRLLASALEGVSDVFTIYDARDRLLFSNRRMQELDSRAPETLKPGITFEERLRILFAKGMFPEAIGREQEWLRERLDRHRNPRGPIEVARQDGVWLLINERRLPGGETATISTDITELKRTQEKLHIAKEQAEFASRTKTDFLANMSHELRTPLNSIIGFSELIRQQSFGKIENRRYVEYANDINLSGNHLLDVINDILDISKIEAQALDITDGEVDVSRAIGTAVKMIQHRALSAKIAISTSVPKRFPRLRADQLRLKQVLLNLLTNSMKFTPPGGRVTLGASLEDGGITLAVSDTGIGIAPEDIPRIMEPFAQAGGAMGHSREGTGLGLTLVKSLVELHGGYLDIDSSLGEGTTVNLHFPPERTLPRAGDRDGSFRRT